MQTVFLIGHMGCGKTTLGSALAACLQVAFIDLDEYIEEKCEMTMNRIFETLGERHFREMECQALHEVAGSHAVVACGGGTPCFGDNMQFMNHHGLTIWLTTSAERIAARLALPLEKSKRPLMLPLDDEEILDYVKSKLRERQPCYSQAQLTFDSTRIETAEETAVTARRLAHQLRSILQ